jgi:hypothetical protein
MEIPGWTRSSVSPHLSLAQRCSFEIGELTAKSTRVLTEEEKALLDIPFVGKNGEKRKLEVSMIRSCLIQWD